MVAIIASLYLLIGVAMDAWFLFDVYRSKVRTDNGDGTESDRRVVSMIGKPVLIAYILGMPVLWPIALLAFLLSGPDNPQGPEEPQDRVPPEYR
jgi:hypothetical protein